MAFVCLETPCTKSLRIVSVGCCLDTLKWTLASAAILACPTLEVIQDL